MLLPFRNEPLTDFTQPANARAFNAVIEEV